MNQSAASSQVPESYAAGLEELEQILNYLRGSDVDLEALAEKVERAGHLIRFCRQRLDDISLKVNDVLDSVNAALDEGQ